ncbi:hypothetical protein [Synechococcus sp. GFB01]|uniref:hypothetical protein n=1 Tax=Synechococcus sp. GFB01 TaxID=1662190 RepID=UPI00064EF9DD|nr:hypothetical protein [Synechococcus sp. GFB01]KMM17821.1 hypothetical protein SYNGFB01_01460 [Synechococcus sp. GFB01]
MASQVTTPGQLAVLRYNAYPLGGSPCFSHMLISSTAPLEAELPYRSDMEPDDLERSAERVLELRRHLDQFFRTPGAGTGNQSLRLVVRIHGYNVPLNSVKNDYAAAERKFQRDAQRMATDPPDDYVLFVDYAWPSERIGAGGPCAGSGPCRWVCCCCSCWAAFSASPRMVWLPRWACCCWASASP